MSADALLSIEDLSIEFDTAAGRVTALRGVSFALKRGEILGVVGESGSGKTVACRSIVRLLAPAARITAGRVLFAGRDMLTLSDRELIAVRGEKIAMIFQNPSTHLDPLMSVGRQIGEALRVHFGTSAAEARRQTIQLLRDVHIAEPERRVDAYPHELSGGMRQRVMIAAALACRPDILIADEPTTALDVTVQAEILRLLERLRAERELAMIIVSHDLGVVAEVCDRVVVMKDGRVVETGAMTEVLERPREDYTRQLVGSQPALMSRWRSEAAAPDGNGGTATRPDSIALERLSVQFSRSPGLIGWMLRRSGHIVNAVDDISLAVRPGETLGIVGESGSGKSTIARAIVGLVHPSAGRIVFNGRPTDQLSKAARLAFRRAVQMVFQDPYTSLDPRYSVFAALAEPLRYHRLCAEHQVADRVRELLDTVELSPELMQRRPYQLSGGQRQRVGIARALALGPEIIIADEVTSALDVTIQAQILELFKRLRREMSLTLILISHDLGVVGHLSDTVAVLQHGRLVEYGAADDVFARPRDPYTRTLLDSIPSLTSRLTALGGMEKP